MAPGDGPSLVQARDLPGLALNFDMNRQSVWEFLKSIVNQWIEDNPFQLASSLSYYTLFSLAPILIIAISVAGFIFGREAAQNQIVQTIQGLVGADSAKAVQSMIQKSSSEPTTGAMSTIVGIVVLLF